MKKGGISESRLFVWALSIFLMSIGLAVLNLSGTLDKVFDRVPTLFTKEVKQAQQRQEEVREFTEREQKCAAYFVWHTVTGSNDYKYAGLEAEQLSFIAFWNAVKTGRPACEVFADADPLLPELTEEYKPVGSYYWQSKLASEVKKDRQEFERMLVTYGPLLGAPSLGEVLPEEIRQYACVSKVVRSKGGWLTRRLSLTLDQLADRMKKSGNRQIDKTVPSPTPEGKPYRFYCPK